jgi:hypothetical protein
MIWIVASRQGLNVVDRTQWRLLVGGCFFGLVCRGDAVFAFRHGSTSASRGPNSGPVVPYVWGRGRVEEAGIVVDGLDHNVHQLDFFDEGYFLVDTFHQRILE